MYLKIIFLILTIMGMVDSLYLFYKYTKKAPLACLIGSDCSAVVESKWSKVFGVRNELWGSFYYILLFIGMLLFIFLPEYSSLIHLLLVLATALGFLYSLFLTGLQMFLIKSFCLYCLFSALISTLLFINTLLLV